MAKLSEQQKFNIDLLEIIHDIANGDDKPATLDKLDEFIAQYKKKRGVK